MRKIIITFFIGFCSFTGYCQQEFVINLKHLATITFPDTPKINIKSTDTVYVAVKSGAIYVAAATHAQKSLKELLTEHILDSMYNSVIVGTLQSSHGKIIYKKKIYLKKLEGLEFGYTISTKDQTLYGFNRVFYLNSTLLNFGRLSRDSLKSDNKELKDFFNTFKLTVSEDNITQDNSSEIGYKIGYGIGTIAFIGVICLIGWFIVVIIKKVTNK
jgi:hypothetical protein